MSKAAKASAVATAEHVARRPRGRPRAFDRDAALEAATRLFWQKGYEATSISDLTQAMGIASPSLYASFGSKEALFAEAVNHYRDKYESLTFGRFLAADTARASVEAFLMDTAIGLTSDLFDTPYGCMVTLSSVAGDEHAELSQFLRAARAATLDKLLARLRRAVAAGEIPPGLDIHALARFIQTVQNGMSVIARDGARRPELEAVAEAAMLGWDARVAAARKAPAKPAAKQARRSVKRA